jgi:hypothetical protein
MAWRLRLLTWLILWCLPWTSDGWILPWAPCHAVSRPRITAIASRAASTSYLSPCVPSTRASITRGTVRYDSLSGGGDEEEKEEDSDYRLLLQQNLLELWQTQRQAPKGTAIGIGSPDLSDLNLFKTQMNQNIAETTRESLLMELPFPDYGVGPGETIRSLEPSHNPPNDYFSPIDIGANTGIFSEENPVEDDDDGFYLDPDIYARSRDLISVDASLDNMTTNNEIDAPDLLSSADGRKAILERLLQSELQARNVPSPASSPGDGYSDWNDAWTLIQQEMSKPFNASQADELHRQVFEKEAGFLSQSEAFQQALSDPEAAERVTTERWNARSKERQDRAREELLANMAKFEQELLEKERIGSTTCSRCRCPLVELDYEIYPQLWMQQRNLTALCETCYRALIASTKNLQTPASPSGSEANQWRQTGSKSWSQGAAYPTSRPVSSQQYPYSTRSARPLRSNEKSTGVSSMNIGQQQSPEKPPPMMTPKGKSRVVMEPSSPSAQWRLERGDKTVIRRQEPSLGLAQASSGSSTNVPRPMVNATSSQAASSAPKEDPDSGKPDVV